MQYQLPTYLIIYKDCYFGLPSGLPVTHLVGHCS